MENVIQLRDWRGYKPMVNELRNLGYNIREDVLDASKFGVPQTRRRLFVLCDHDGEPAEVKSRHRKLRPASDAIRIPFLIVYYGSDGAGGWQSIDRPLRTLTTLDRFGLVTWDGKEPMLWMLQVEELRRAMGFPASHVFDRGTRRDKIRLLGNGVAPPVMKAIVETLARE